MRVSARAHERQRAACAGGAAYACGKIHLVVGRIDSNVGPAKDQPWPESPRPCRKMTTLLTSRSLTPLGRKTMGARCLSAMRGEADVKLLCEAADAAVRQLAAVVTTASVTSSPCTGLALSMDPQWPVVVCVGSGLRPSMQTCWQCDGSLGAKAVECTAVLTREKADFDAMRHEYAGHGLALTRGGTPTSDPSSCAQRQKVSLNRTVLAFNTKKTQEGKQCHRRRTAYLLVTVPLVLRAGRGPGRRRWPACAGSWPRRSGRQSSR